MGSDKPQNMRDIPSMPLCTTSVLCAVQIFGFGVESRKSLLDGTRHSISEMDDLVNYALNPFLPGYVEGAANPDNSPESRSLQNVDQAFRFLIAIQRKYFELLVEHGYAVRDKKFRDYVYSTQESLKSLCKRYLILCSMDGVNPYDICVNWGAPFDFCDESLKKNLMERLNLARQRVKNLRNMDVFYMNKGRTLTTPVGVLTRQFKAFLSHLGEAAYLNAAGFCRNDHPDVQKGRAKVCDNIEKACRHLNRLVMDLLKCELFSMIKNLRDDARLKQARKLELLSGALRARAADHAPVSWNTASRTYEICEDTFMRHHEIYRNAVERLYEYVEYDPHANY